MQLEFTQDLSSASLSTEEALLYELLLRLGEQPASRLAREIPSPHNLSRPLVYKVLDSLIEKNLVEKHDPAGGVAVFRPKHPVGIVKTLEAKQEALNRTKEQFKTVAGSLASLFNLTAGKPGVQFYEGEDGLWELLKDTLSAQEEILTYADLEAIDKYVPKINAGYSALREKQGVKKRGLVIDSPAARKFLRSYDGSVTTTKLIKTEGDFVPFQTVTQIYDNKVSYATFTDQYIVGIIITDQFIANTHKYLFESLWHLSPGEVI